MSFMFALLAQASALSFGLPPVPPESIADFVCAVNAIAANRVSKTQTFRPLETFYEGRLSVRDEKRNWSWDATWVAGTKDPSISMSALKECMDRYGRYLMLDGKPPS